MQQVKDVLDELFIRSLSPKRIKIFTFPEHIHKNRNKNNKTRNKVKQLKKKRGY
jgi:hypothetical protein